MNNSEQSDIADRNAIFKKLNIAATQTPGFKLLTVMELDLPAEKARRAYSSDQNAYPTSGTKPIQRNQWFKDVVEAQKPFLANQPKDMGDQFPDIAIIENLGCGSVVNVPVVKNGQTVAVINILHEENYFTPERYAQALQLANLMNY